MCDQNPAHIAPRKPNAYIRQGRSNLGNKLKLTYFAYFGG